MTVQIWKAPHWPTYIVQVGASIWEMSRDANMPNGVCQYVGGVSQRPERDITYLVDDMPIGIVRQICRLIQIENGAATA